MTLYSHFFTSNLLANPAYFDALEIFPVHSHCYCFGSAIVMSHVDYYNRFLIDPCF